VGDLCVEAAEGGKLAVLRVFVPPECFEGEKFEGGREVYKRLANVLRLRPGDEFVAVDGSGVHRLVEITGIGRGRVMGRVLEEREVEAEPPVRFVVAQAIPKGEKMEFIVQKATELGAAEIWPFVSERVVPRWDEETSKRKVERWRKVAREASAQCGRARVPEVREVMAFEDLLEGLSLLGASIALDEGPKAEPLGEVARELGRQEEVGIVVGPEGGLTEDELGALERAGAIRASLGPRILRTETAPIVALSILGFLWADLGSGRDEREDAP